MKGVANFFLWVALFAAAVISSAIGFLIWVVTFDRELIDRIADGPQIKDTGKAQLAASRDDVIAGKRVFHNLKNITTEIFRDAQLSSKAACFIIIILLIW